MNDVSEKVARRQPFEVLLDQEQIARRIRELGQQITNDYAGQTPVLIGILKGCVVFLSDLMRSIQLPVELEFVSASSYRNGIVAEDTVVIGGGVSISLKGRQVLLVDGIIDSCRTISMVHERIQKEEPAGIEIVTLLDKPASHRRQVKIKYKGFSVGNDFVIGFGLDNTQRYRNLPFIGRMID